MKKYCMSVAAMVMGVIIGRGISLAGDGAKALFFGETVTHTVEIKETGDNAAAFSGTEMKTETIEAPDAQPVSQTSPKKPASLKKKSAAVVKNRKKVTSKEIATGLSYWIEVIKPDGGKERTTAESRVFRTGERIRFVFKSNKEGHLYLLLIGSSGRGSVLFPDPRINSGNNFVSPNEQYQIPYGEKTFVMDSTPGEEKVLVFFSPSEINDITSYFMPKSKIEPQETRAIYAYAETRGSKDIVFEDDAVGVGIQPASYIVSRSAEPKEVIFKEIVVKHQ